MRIVGVVDEGGNFTVRHTELNPLDVIILEVKMLKKEMH